MFPTSISKNLVEILNLYTKPLMKRLQEMNLKNLKANGRILIHMQ